MFTRFETKLEQIQGNVRSIKFQNKVYVKSIDKQNDITYTIQNHKLINNNSENKTLPGREQLLFDTILSKWKNLV